MEKRPTTSREGMLLQEGAACRAHQRALSQPPTSPEKPATMLQRAKVIARVAQQAGLSPARLEQAIAEPRRVPSWVFLGPPGVGKGTYASRVADALGLAHIAAGDLVRHEMKAQTELGRKVGRRGARLHRPSHLTCFLCIF